MNTFTSRITIIIFGLILAQGYLLTTPIFLWGKDTSTLLSILVGIWGVSEIIITHQQMKIWEWVSKEPNNLDHLWKLIFRFSPHLECEEDAEGISAVVLMPITVQDMKNKIAKFLGTTTDLRKICMRLTWSHIVRWKAFRASAFMMTILLIAPLSAVCSDTIPKLEISPFFGGTALMLTDITDGAADAETGIIAGVEALVNFKSGIYASIATGYDSHSFNDRPSFKGTFIEVGTGATILSQWPWQASFGVFWKSSFDNGKTLQQYGIKPAIYWKNFFIKAQFNFYEYDQSNLGGSAVCGVRIPIIRNHQGEGQTTPSFHSR